MQRFGTTNVPTYEVCLFFLKSLLCVGLSGFALRRRVRDFCEEYCTCITGVFSKEGEGRLKFQYFIVYQYTIASFSYINTRSILLLPLNSFVHKPRCQISKCRKK